MDGERVAGDARAVAERAGGHRDVVRVRLGDHDRARLLVVRRAVLLLPEEHPAEERRLAHVDAVAVEAVDHEDVDERQRGVVDGRLRLRLRGGGREGEAEGTRAARARSIRE